MSNNIISPFHSESQLIKTVPVSQVVAMYKEKCGVYVTESFGSLQEIELYKCMKTGYRFWYPLNLAGDTQFYDKVSLAWENYYKETRWEYKEALANIQPSDSVLEVGCGRGFFLKELEEKGVSNALGLDFNPEAINNKVTKFDILDKDLNELDIENKFDVICFFQVLEHVSDPFAFLTNVKKLLNKGGRLIYSVPNNEFAPLKNMQDAFDLPPHHVGQYNLEIIENIAHTLDMEIMRNIEEKSPINYQYYKNKLGGLYYILKLPIYLRSLLKSNVGHTLLAVYKEGKNR